MADTATKPQGADSITPIIVEAGARSKKSIRNLKRGTGKLMREVSDIVQDARATSGTSAGGVQPIVIVYRQKRGRKIKKSMKSMGFPIPTPFDLLR